VLNFADIYWIAVTNNQLDIVFTLGSADLPKVSAIQIH
jgi:hypothetical protein